MAKYESKTKHIPYSQSAVYAKISDLSNLSVLKERLANQDIPENLKEQADAEQIGVSQVRRQNGVRVAYPVHQLRPLHQAADQIGIQLVPTSDSACAMRLTLDAELNMFLKMAVGGKLKDGIDKFADMLAKIPYGD